MRLSRFKLVLKEEKTEYKIDNRRRYNSPQEIAKLSVDFLNINQEPEEFVYCFCFDTKGHIQGIFEISHGSCNATFLPQREIFQKALFLNANSIILVHNHPSGSLEPSKEDITSTNKLIEAGELIGIRILDHIIVSSYGEYSSMREDGYIK